MASIHAPSNKSYLFSVDDKGQNYDPIASAYPGHADLIAAMQQIADQPARTVGEGVVRGIDKGIQTYFATKDKNEKARLEKQYGTDRAKLFTAFATGGVDGMRKARDELIASQSPFADEISGNIMMQDAMQRRGLEQAKEIYGMQNNAEINKARELEKIKAEEADRIAKANAFTPMTPEETKAAGLSGNWARNSRGELKQLAKSDVLSPEAQAQKVEQNKARAGGQIQGQLDVDAGKSLRDEYEKNQGLPGQLQMIGQTLDLLDDDNVTKGPLSGSLTKLMSYGNALGIPGINQEALAKSQSIGSALTSLMLNDASKMKGSLSDKDVNILNEALGRGDFTAAANILRSKMGQLRQNISDYNDRYNKGRSSLGSRGLELQDMSLQMPEGRTLTPEQVRGAPGKLRVGDVLMGQDGKKHQYLGNGAWTD